MVSVIVVTWNSEQEIISCLNSIVKQKADYPELEIILVDNNSQDKTKELVKKEFGEVVLINNKRNLGYARANNQGLSRARGEYILLVNPDVILTDNFLAPLVDFLEKHKEVGAVAPKLLNPDLSVQKSIRSFPDYQILLWEISGLAKLMPYHKIFGKWRLAYFNYDKEQEIEQPMTSCLLVRKLVFDAIGYFDERFEMFFNDVDLCRRMISAGWKIYYLPHSFAIHNRGSSTRKVRNRMIFSMHKSLYHYFEKYDKSGWFGFKKLFIYPILLFSAILRALGASLIK